MTLEIKKLATSNIINEKQNEQFSPEQLEILKEEFSKKLAEEEMKNLENLDVINHYRKKYCVSKRDAIDIIARNKQGY